MKKKIPENVNTMKKRNLWLIFALCAIVLVGCQKKTVEVSQDSTEVSNQETATPAADTPNDSSQGKTIEPLPSTLDLTKLDDCIFTVSFLASDVRLNEDGALVITMTVYDCDKFDLVDISQLAVGDTIVIEGQNVNVSSIETNDYYVSINGGVENDGWDLSTMEDGVYIPTVMDSGPVYHALGEVTLPVDQDFIFTDSSDPQNPPKQYYAGDFLTDMENSDRTFSQQATSVRTEGGKIVELNQAYMP